MPEKKQESFTVTDRRLFTPEGDARNEITQEELPSSTPKAAATLEPPPTPAPPTTPAPEAATDMPPTPTAAEQQEQADAYRKSAKDLDTRVELSGHSAK